MQQFQNHDWGLNLKLDPKFGKSTMPPAMVCIKDPEKGVVDIILGEKWVSHYGLNGRVTNVVSMTSQKFTSEGHLVAKVFWAE